MKKQNFLIGLGVLTIFILGLLLRLYRLDLNIPSLYADEVGGHYIFRQQILDTDQSILQKIVFFVQTAPLSYSWLLGLNPLGARLASAINGSFICMGVFLFAYSASQKENRRKRLLISFVACFLSAFLPWSFMVSRIFSHIPLMLFFVCLHLYLFIKSNSTKADLISLLPLLIGTYYYMSMAVVAPFAILLVFLSVLQRSTPKQKVKLATISLAIGALFLYIFVSKFGLFNPKGRGLDLAIWNDVNVTADSNLYRGIARTSPPTIFSFGKDPELIGNKMLFNYPLSVMGVFTKNYLSFFSPDFLFLKGDNVLRHSTGIVGQFWPILLPFMLYGAYVFSKTSDKKLRNLFLVWILVSPIPGAITKDGPTYLLRVITLMPFLSYFCALGIATPLDLFRKKWQKITYLVFVSGSILFSAYYFYYGYFHVYPTISAQSWEYGFKEVSDFNSDNPEKMLIIWDDTYPYLYFCFWQKLPHDICNPTIIDKARENINDTRIDLPFENLLFSLPKNEFDLTEIIQKYKPKYVVIPQKRQTLFPVFIKKNIPIETIKYPDQTTAFSIYQVY